LLYADTGDTKLLSPKAPDLLGCMHVEDNLLLFCEDNGQGGSRMMLYDLDKGGDPWAVSEPGAHEFLAHINGDKIYYSTPGFSDAGMEYDIWVYDIEKRTREVLVDDHGYQMGLAVEGYIIIYHDSDDSMGVPCRLIIRDLKTGEQRVMTPEEGHYYNQGIHGKYYSFMHHNKVYLCDLEEGGFIDQNGHLIPEPVDGGK